GRKTKVGRKLLRFPPTRFYIGLSDCDYCSLNYQQGMVLFIVISCCDIVCWFKTTTSYGESAPLAVQLAPLIFRTTSLIKLFDTHHSLSI
ncbi:hypothetical protein, partial [uncultured Phocaeicola sp.]|uniref:hypothetical protein n=1 Tax=uncultured Phocaeicola sp. TaxID=990718 RepID=UPI0030C769C1